MNNYFRVIIKQSSTKYENILQISQNKYIFNYFFYQNHFQLNIVIFYQVKLMTSLVKGCEITFALENFKNDADIKNSTRF